LILYGGEWGYWDRNRQWHHAPDPVARQLNERQSAGWSGHPGGAASPAGGYQQPRYQSPPPVPGNDRYGGAPAYRAPDPVRPAAAPYAAPRPLAAPATQPAPPERERNRECPQGQPRC
jgi:hypothetical protein